MKKKIILIGITVICCFGFFACEQAIPAPELEKFMYVSWADAKNNPCIKKLNLGSEQDTVFFINIIYGGTTNYEQGDITANIAADLSLVEAFNTANSTSYLPLPDGSYTLNAASAIIANGSNVSDPLQLTVKTSLINFRSEYILPITVNSLSGGKLPLNEELKTLYIVIQGDIDDDAAMGKWVSAGASSTEINYGVEKAFDGNSDSYWQSGNTGMPQWFAVDMNGYKQIDGFTLNNRKNDNSTAKPKHIIIETSMNGNDWTKVAEVDELGQSKDMQIVPLAETVIARYFKITVESVWSGAFTCLAEIGYYFGQAPEIVVPWTIVSSSGQLGGGVEAEKAIDGNPGTFWHTQTDGSFPYWFIVDFHKTLRINGILFTNYAGNENPKHVVFEASNDMVTWTTILEIDELSRTLTEQTLPCDVVVSAKYLRVSILNVWSGGGWAYISEIGIY